MCEHKNLKSVGKQLFCKDCGKELDMAFLTAQKQPEKAAQDDKPAKSPAKKTRAKKAE
ncbi:MAG: hypothetical protein IIZ93_01485 [Acidaminococcaceae bacterium]|nr:hypothetical protein [Acidaminococcaceae bacterium]